MFHRFIVNWDKSYCDLGIVFTVFDLAWDCGTEISVTAFVCTGARNGRSPVSFPIGNKANFYLQFLSKVSTSYPFLLFLPFTFQKGEKVLARVCSIKSAIGVVSSQKMYLFDPPSAALNQIKIWCQTNTFMCNMVHPSHFLTISRTQHLHHRTHLPIYFLTPLRSCFSDSFLLIKSVCPAAGAARISCLHKLMDRKLAVQAGPTLPRNAVAWPVKQQLFWAWLTLQICQIFQNHISCFVFTLVSLAFCFQSLQTEPEIRNMNLLATLFLSSGHCSQWCKTVK